MADTVVETIKSIIRKHLEEGNGLLFGQCVTLSVGFVNKRHIADMFNHYCHLFS